MTTRRIELELPESLCELLGVLAADARVTEDPVAHVLLRLAAHASDGVARPGAWERAWIAQAFGTDWIERLEPDPATAQGGNSVYWRQRPKR